MKMGFAQLALRELQEIMSDFKRLSVLCLVVILCTLSGPFGTINVLDVIPRFAYWSFIVMPTYAFGVMAHWAI